MSSVSCKKRAAGDARCPIHVGRRGGGSPTSRNAREPANFRHSRWGSPHRLARLAIRLVCLISRWNKCWSNKRGLGIWPTWCAQRHPKCNTPPCSCTLYETTLRRQIQVVGVMVIHKTVCDTRQSAAAGGRGRRVKLLLTTGAKDSGGVVSIAFCDWPQPLCLGRLWQVDGD